MNAILTLLLAFFMSEETYVTGTDRRQITVDLGNPQQQSIMSKSLNGMNGSNKLDTVVKLMSITVFKQPLALHSTSPMTGYLRNGYCEVNAYSIPGYIPSF